MPSDERGANAHMAPGQPALFEATLMATEPDVRQCVVALRTALSDRMSEDDLPGRIELVAAEVLNNIAEHAYSGSAPGPIRVLACLVSDAVVLRIVDEGGGLPNGCLPNADLPEIGEDPAHFPEGGFGWALILRLTDDVRYARIDGHNHLELRFDPKPAASV